MLGCSRLPVSHQLILCLASLAPGRLVSLFAGALRALISGGSLRSCQACHAEYKAPPFFTFAERQGPQVCWIRP
jgi:hypothetical protein